MFCIRSHDRASNVLYSPLLFCVQDERDTVMIQDVKKLGAGLRTVMLVSESPDVQLTAVKRKSGLSKLVKEGKVIARSCCGCCCCCCHAKGRRGTSVKRFPSRRVGS